MLPCQGNSSRNTLCGEEAISVCIASAVANPAVLRERRSVPKAMGCSSSKNVDGAVVSKEAAEVKESAADFRSASAAAAPAPGALSTRSTHRSIRVSFAADNDVDEVSRRPSPLRHREVSMHFMRFNERRWCAQHLPCRRARMRARVYAKYPSPPAHASIRPSDPT
eukprot:6207888-Pleurochrysis_carterae.AAC.1